MTVEVKAPDVSNLKVVLEQIVAQLDHLIELAESAGHSDLANRLRAARLIAVEQQNNCL